MKVDKSPNTRQEAADFLADVENRPAAETSQPSQEASADDAQKSEDPRDALARRLKLDISDDDLQDYVFNGRISKTISVVDRILDAEFHTNSAGDLSEINKRIGEISKSDPDMIQRELLNQNTLLLLGHSIRALGRPGKLQSIGKTVDERISKLKDLAPEVVTKLSQRYNLLQYVLNKRLEDPEEVKKS